MLSNIEPIGNLGSLFRLRGRTYVTKTVGLSSVDEMLIQGWSITQKNEKSFRLKKDKEGHLALTDRVWSLLFRMGFLYLNGEGKATLTADVKDPKSQTIDIDVVGIDMEVGLAIWCRSSEEKCTKETFRQELDEFILSRERFAQSINQEFPLPFDRQSKRVSALAVFTSGIFISEKDKQRAKDGKIILFGENELSYYETLVSHLGEAAKYQFLADMLPNKIIPGLNMRVPAIKTRMGRFTCYTFSIPPEYLLKISYVSHRSKGRGSDINTYQRMIQKSRLEKIRRYIDDRNIFPTNIVINFDLEPEFHQTQQETEQESGVMGWLDIRSAYKSAWIIDGQHRLFAYSGHPQASKARLSVLAFEMLPPNDQSQLFIDINHEQKSVKQSLLRELFGNLHEDAKEPELRIQAIITQAILSLDSDPNSPFYQRIQASDDKKNDIRCITLTSLSRALDTGFYFVGPRRGEVVEYGPLWSNEGNDATKIRTLYIINNWFHNIREVVPDWWDAGAGEGGGLSMNDSVTACIMVLRSVFQHLATHGVKLLDLSKEELFEQVTPYMIALGNYLASLTEDERKQYRALRGVQGQTTRTKRIEQTIHQIIPEFFPPGLKDFIEKEKARTNDRAKTIVDKIERILQTTIIEELKREFGTEETQWWMQGIPGKIRMKTSDKYEQDSGKRGGKEFYFDLIDYREIISSQWTLFQKFFGYGKGNASKEKRTSWINFVNDIRKIVAHSSSGGSVTLEQLAELEMYEKWLDNQIKQVDDSEATTSDEDT